MQVLGYSQLPRHDVIGMKMLLSRALQGKQYLEIGSWCGESTVIIAKQCKTIGAKLFCVDTWGGSEGTELLGLAEHNNVFDVFMANMKEAGVDDVIETLRMTSDEAVSLFEDEQFDFVFIDGDHKYNQISKDIKNYFPKCKEGGIFSGHDLNRFTWDEECIEQDFVNGVHHGVSKAVMETFGQYKNPIYLYGTIWSVEK